MLEGIGRILASTGLPPTALRRIVHATTLFTNALIERRGARTGLLTTEGFRDTLEIGRERKYDLYDLTIENPPPLVPRDLRQEVAEWVAADVEAEPVGLVAGYCTFNREKFLLANVRGLLADPGVDGDPAQLGEHTRALLAELGYADAAIEQLMADGAVTAASMVGA